MAEVNYRQAPSRSAKETAEDLGSSGRTIVISPAACALMHAGTAIERYAQTHGLNSPLGSGLMPAVVAGWMTFGGHNHLVLYVPEPWPQAGASANNPTINWTNPRILPKKYELRFTTWKTGDMFSPYYIDDGAIVSPKKPDTKWPHVCPKASCRAPAYIGFTTVECSKGKDCR